MSFEHLVARQAGVVSLAQAVAAGMSPDTVRCVRQGRLSRLHPGIYLVGGHRRTPEARVRAAWLWGGPHSVVTGPAAFPAQRVAIEVDGWAWHVDPERFRNDRRNGGYITPAGWDLLRFRREACAVTT